MPEPSKFWDKNAERYYKDPIKDEGPISTNCSIPANYCVRIWNYWNLVAEQEGRPSFTRRM